MDERTRQELVCPNCQTGVTADPIRQDAFCHGCGHSFPMGTDVPFDQQLDVENLRSDVGLGAGDWDDEGDIGIVRRKTLPQNLGPVHQGAWHLSTDRLNWTLGKAGKGNVYKDLDVETWNVSPNGNPHHSEVAGRSNETPIFLFYIGLDGGVSDGGLDYLNKSSLSDENMIQHILDTDPSLHKASVYDGINVPSARVEYEGGGFGHAKGLLDRFSWVEGTEGLEGVETPQKAPEDELAAWLKGFSAPQANSISPHHDDVGGLFVPSSVYDWQQDGDY